MSIQIKLHHLGHFERGDEAEFWVDAKGNSRYTLETLLANFWCAVCPEGAEGPATAIRFVGFEA